MATFYIQLENKLLQISGELTAENISKALGYVPVDSSTMSNYATKDEVSDLVDMSMVEELSQRVDNITFDSLKDNPFLQDGSGELNIVDEAGNIIAKIDANGIHSVDFIAGEHLLSEKADKKDIPSLEGYATEKFVTDKIAEAEIGGEEIDLSEYAKKTDLEGLATEQWVEDKGYLTEHQDVSHLATKDEIPSLEGFATESWVEGQNYAKKNEIPSADFNLLENNPFAEDESGELNMTDESGNVGFKLNEQGLFVKDVVAGEHVLSNKIDKVSGKQLSTEDFTSILKTKLEGLSNYDDTELSNALSTLRGDFDTLVSGDTTTAIKTFNEVIAFLDSISDTEDLAGIIASIEQQLMWTKAEGEAGVRLKGTNGTATGNFAISAGDDKKASDGTQFTSVASGDHAVVFGFGNTCAGRTTLAQGLYNTINGKDSVAFGQRNLVDGDQAFAAGQQNEVTARLGVAMGYKNKATNTDSIAIGYQNTSSGSASVAMGDTCEANGTSSTAMGYKTKATGAYSSTFGQNTQATNEGEVAMGLYNKSTTSTDASKQTLFSFGIGTSDTNRTNAFEIKKNGDVYVGDNMLFDIVNERQEKLISGTNIKTINGTSLLGSGDITIEGNSGSLTENDDVTVKSITVKDSITVGDYAVNINSDGTVDAMNVHSSNGFTDYSSGIEYYMTLGDYGIEIVKSAHSPNDSEKTILTTITSGNGTKFLSDDGTYKPINGGGSSSGRKEVVEVEEMGSGTITNMRPNVIYWCYGAANWTIESFEAPLQEQTSYDVFTAIIELGDDGDPSLSITLPDYVEWANGIMPEFPEDFCEYELSISRISDGYGREIGSEYYYAVLTPFKEVA